jgi:hypothetical protein
LLWGDMKHFEEPVRVGSLRDMQGTAVADLSGQEVEELQKLRKELPYFARKALKIRTKSGEVLPFGFNRSQDFLHHKVEQQSQATGKVRKIVVKGRQLGSTTYIQGRFYHRLWKCRRALQAFILTHEAPASQNVFAMAKRFYDLHPEGLARPPEHTSNIKELRFADNDCGYQVATAGTEEIGRSATIQLFHGSEVAFWPHAESHATGLFNTVGNAPGTEIILESTANGIGNYFHKAAMAAIRGNSEFEATFIPWFWGEDYVQSCPDSFEPSEKWVAYGELNDLTWEQLYWAFIKNRELANTISAALDEPCWRFMQEYPSNFEEAFQTSGNSFIPAAQVMMARKASVIGSGPVILGIDPSRIGDKVGLIDRCGRRMGERICERWTPPGNSITLANMIAAVINRIKPDMVNMDVGGGGDGAAIYDLLMDWGYAINPVNFGSSPLTTSPTGDDGYFNRRAEMHDWMRQWFNDDQPKQIPDDDGLQSDLTSIIGLGSGEAGATRYNTNNELILEEKEHIKKRLGHSPDLGDAAALTFAVPYQSNLQSAATRGPARNNSRRNRRTGY